MRVLTTAKWTRVAGKCHDFCVRRKILLAVFSLTMAASCIELPPDRVPLSAQAESVELVSEFPNPDLYESYEFLTSEAIGKGSGEAMTNARNGLRNKAAALRATFVSIEEASATTAWDFSGRTVVTLRGHVFRPKD